LFDFELFIGVLFHFLPVKRIKYPYDLLYARYSILYIFYTECSKICIQHVHHVDFYKSLRDKEIVVKIGPVRTYKKRRYWAHNPEVAGSNPAPTILI
jgi:hypothetical protein